MSTQEPFLFTDSELESQNCVGTLSQLTDDELRSITKHFAQCIRFRYLPTSFHRWIKHELVHEAARRDSDGKIEVRLLSVPMHRMNFEERKQALFAMESISRKRLSDSERAFIDAVRWQFVQSFMIAAERKLDRVLTKREVAEVLQVDDTQVMRLVRTGILRQPTKLSPRHLRWLESDVYAAIGRMQTTDAAAS